jgi:metal-responsive CopG/Arc/MetJ family transcriptional regulator
MKTVSVNFQEDILKNLDELAFKLGTSRSNALMIVLRENVILSLIGKECGKYGKEICK